MRLGKPYIAVAKTFGLCERMGVTVANLIKHKKTREGWSYQRLGDELGVTKSTAHGWANGDIKPDIRSLKRIAKRLGLDLDTLVELTMRGSRS